MDIIISNSDNTPIYQQIHDQIKTKIIDKELVSGELLPSIRSLAKDLRISVITTKRAYEELEREGFIFTTPGKGCFIAGVDQNLLKEELLQKLEHQLTNAVILAKQADVDKAALLDLVAYLYQEG